MKEFVKVNWGKDGFVRFMIDEWRFDFDGLSLEFLLSIFFFIRFRECKFLNSLQSPFHHGRASNRENWHQIIAYASWQTLNNFLSCPSHNHTKNHFPLLFLVPRVRHNCALNCSLFMFLFAYLWELKRDALHTK